SVTPKSIASSIRVSLLTTEFRNFKADEPNKKCVTDITELKARNGKLYVSAIFDCFDLLACGLAIDTVNSAVAARGKSNGIIFHTDRGCQFTSSQFRKHLDSLNMIQSFSAKGYPYDNAVMECFFKYLKKEEINRKTYASFDDLNLSLFQYINGFYNSIRPHSHNNGLSPIHAELDFI
ncbi:MAG: IS3 family transposase, partial [Clostridium sp.]|nr:IS3 family transposase [Clostridium sp.]